MIPLFSVAAALLLMTSAPPPPDAHWLIGTWLVATGPEDRDLAACASGLPIDYAANGTYSLWEESGRWELAGDRLTETATVAHEDIAAPADVAIGRPANARLERIGADEMRKIFADGDALTLLRCLKSE